MKIRANQDEKKLNFQISHFFWNLGVIFRFFALISQKIRKISDGHMSVLRPRREYTPGVGTRQFRVACMGGNKGVPGGNKGVPGVTRVCNLVLRV